MKRSFLAFASILTVALCLHSCDLWENQNSHSTAIWTSFQITNNSSENVTLSFKKEGKPFSTYAEIYNQSEIIALTVGNTEKEITSLQYSSELQLTPGQTILFYRPTGTGDTRYPTATSLATYGYGPSLNPIKYVAKNILGDSIIISSAGKTEETISSHDENLWTTWYDEKQYIYYHVAYVQ